MASYLGIGKRRPNMERFCEIVAALMWGPKTVNELVEIVGADRLIVRGYLDTMEASGLVKPHGFAQRNPGGGAPAIKWAMRTKPFADEVIA